MSSFGPIAYNIDVNQLGAGTFPRFSITQPTPYQDALVEDVILGPPHPKYAKDGSNIGMIQVRFIPGDRGVPLENLNWATPLESSIREYPLKNELVLVFYSLGRLFYTKRINSTNKITESSWPGLSQRFSSKVSAQQKNDSAIIAAGGGKAYEPTKLQASFTVGNEFRENPDVRMVRPFEGDLIIQGRFGSILRFGSNLFSNPNVSVLQPNLLLTVGQGKNKKSSTSTSTAYSLVYEDINNDKSCIWMVTDEKVVLNPATKNSIAHLRSAEISNSKNYTGAQIFVNSDRVIVNSKQNEISLFSKAEINLSAVESITMDAGKSVLITAERNIKLGAFKDVFISGNTFVVNTRKDISQETSGIFTISGEKIFIGSEGDESQPMVLGGELANWLQELIRLLSTATVITSTGPAFFDPKVAIGLVKLATDLGTPKSPQSARFNSTSNFTSKTN